MAISDKDKWALDHMNRTAYVAQLGTVIQGLQNITGYTGDVTVSAAGVTTIAAGAVAETMIDRDEVSQDFTKPFTFAGVKTDGNVEDWIGSDGTLLQCLNVGDKTANATWVRGTGMDFNFDATDNEGGELTVDGSASGCDASFVAGTDDFFVEAKIALADVSGADECYIGFRKAEAFNATFDNYDEVCSINNNAGDVYFETILNNGTTAVVDSTDNIADTEYLIARIEHKSSVGLSSAITLCTEIMVDYAAHLADITQHTTLADAVNIIDSAVPTTLATLKLAVAELLTNYDLHEGDSELGAAWLYHDAQESGDCSLASAVAPTTLPECIARLNDFKIKFKVHDDDATSHGAQTQHAVSAVPASSVTFTTGVNAALAAPTVTTQFTFDDTEEVVPFIRILNTGDFMGTAVLSSFKCGRL